MSKAYITGTMDREQLEMLRDSMKEHVSERVIPYDVMEELDEHEAMKARLHAVLDADVVVTTGPNQGPWTEAARREVALARLAGIEVVPGITFIQPTT
jgi:hypothetical protein